MCPGFKPNPDQGIRSDWIERNPLLVVIFRKVIACRHREPGPEHAGVRSCKVCVSPAERRVLNAWFEKAWGIAR